MQLRRAREIRERWLRRGNPPPHCDHWSLEKEYDGKTHTGDWVCLECGDVFSKAEAELMRHRKRKLRDPAERTQQ